LHLADERTLTVTYQWLYSTRGEIALAERDWATAEAWFRRGLPEAERHTNPEMAATYRANLGLAAQGRGDLDSALALLTSASVALTDAHQRARLDLCLAELHLERGEPALADRALSLAETQLADGERLALRGWAQRLRQGLPAQGA
jgi:hypothetical protein